MLSYMIYKISPNPSFPQRGKEEGLYQRGEIEGIFQIGEIKERFL